MASGTVLVTGASTGIGEATVVHLKTLGFNAVGAVRKDEDELALAVAQAVFDASVAAAIEENAAAVEALVADWGNHDVVAIRCVRGS